MASYFWWNYLKWGLTWLQNKKCWTQTCSRIIFQSVSPLCIELRLFKMIFFLHCSINSDYHLLKCLITTCEIFQNTLKYFQKSWFPFYLYSKSVSVQNLSSAFSSGKGGDSDSTAQCSILRNKHHNCQEQPMQINRRLPPITKDDKKTL